MDMIVNNNWITLSYDEWVEKYKPHLRENDETYIKYYETYGDDWDYVKSVPQVNVWTMMDHMGDGINGLNILNGRHFVNRVMYIVTEIPWVEGESISVEEEYS